MYVYMRLLYVALSAAACKRREEKTRPILVGRPAAAAGVLYARTHITDGAII
jgi:hypothetical protein